MIRIHYIFIFIGLATNGISQISDSLISFDFSVYLNSRNGWVYESTSLPPCRYCSGVKCNGEIIDTLDNGVVLHKAFYVDGNQHGIVSDYYPSGRIRAIGECIYGTRIGAWNFFFENGNIESEITYAPNLPEPMKWVDYYENGCVESKLEYNDQGFLICDFDFNENGDTTFAYYSIDPEYLVYEFFERHANGQLKEAGRWKFGENEVWVKVGVWKWFDESGKLTEKISYGE